MKNLFALPLVFLLGACTQSATEITEVNEAEKSPVEEQVVSQMSIHLFDLPEGVSEEEYLTDIEKMNSFFIASGYGKNYTVLKVADDNDAESYRYALVSSYPSAEVYEASHDQGEEYSAFMDELTAKYSSIWDTEIYRKVYTIN